MFGEEAACGATPLGSILEISQRLGAACNIFLVKAPAEFRYAPVFGEKTPLSSAKQRCLFRTVRLREQNSEMAFKLKPSSNHSHFFLVSFAPSLD